jgi:hypothetical protein
MHDGSVISLLGAHNKAYHCVQALEPEVLRDDGILGVDVVLVAEGVVGRDRGVVGGRGGLTVSQHGDYDYVVGCKTAGCEVQGRVYTAAKQVGIRTVLGEEGLKER